MDINEHRPQVDEWFKMMNSFDVKINGHYLKLTSGRVTLYFKPNGETGKFDYDGWETFVGDMGLKTQ